MCRCLQKPANILVMGEGPERGRVKIGKYFQIQLHVNESVSASLIHLSIWQLTWGLPVSSIHH